MAMDKHISPMSDNSTRQVSFAQGTCAAGHHYRPCETFQYLRSNLKSLNQGTLAAIPHRDARSPVCPASLPLPRGNNKTINYRRAHYEQWRMGHGSARAIENLRGLRQPFLPRPNSREYLLPGMCGKTEGLSNTCQPQTQGPAQP
jgi:hypothetical protein